MGEVRHLQFDSLSALLDGELPGQEAVAARAHLTACSACQADVASLARLEDELRLPPALDCTAAAPFLSAQRDGEADAVDGAIASRHLSRCDTCRAAATSWTAFETMLAGPLVMPSARVDAAVAALTRTGSAPRGPRSSGVPLGVAWRGAVVAVLALAIAFGSTLAPRDDDVATPADDASSFVAAVQQVVFDRRTNTLYVAEPEAGAVNALNAADHSLRARIAVGGRPTALALNEAAHRVIVLDSAAKRFTEIDTERNAVVGSTAIDVAGTPTSIQEVNGKIAVFLAVAAKTPTASAAATVASGNVAVFDPATKALETVRSVDAPSSLVVPDPNGGRTLLVSPKATTVVDASYKTIETLAGGIGAAFGHDSGRIAVLSAESDGARVTFYGENAPASVRLAGRAASVIGLPGGGFAVLLDVGGRGRIELLDAAGKSTGGTDVALTGRHLTYDAAEKRFTVVGDGASVAFAALPGAVAAAPTQSGAPSPAPSAPPTASATPAPSGSPAPSATPSPAPSAPASRPPQPSAVAGVPAGAVRVGTALYRVPIGDGRVPVLAASGADRIWFLDERNQLAAINPETGASFIVAQLPRDAVIRGLAVGLTHVYLVDVSKARLFEFSLASEVLTPYHLPVTDISAITVAPEGTVWVAMPGTSQVLAFDRRTGRFQAIDLRVRGAVALAADAGGRLWFSDGVAKLGAYDASEAKVFEVAWPGRAAPSVLLADPAGRVWAGTARGEIYVLSGGLATAVASVGNPVSVLALDPSGRPWYLAPALQVAGFVYGPVDRSQAARSVPGPATSLGFGRSGNAWLADPSGAFYIGVEAAR